MIRSFARWVRWALDVIANQLDLSAREFVVIGLSAGLIGCAAGGVARLICNLIGISSGDVTFAITAALALCAGDLLGRRANRAHCESE